MSKYIDQILRPLLYKKEVIEDVQLYHVDQLLTAMRARQKKEDEELQAISQIIEDKRLDKLLTTSLYFKHRKEF